MKGKRRTTRRATILLMIVGLLAMLFIIVSAFIVMARFDRQTLRLTSQGQQVEQILSTVEKVVIDGIAQRAGTDLISGANYADIPGYGGVKGGRPWGSPWLASPEPVRDPNAPNARPGDYRYPAVTSLEGGGPGAKRLTDLMLDDPNWPGGTQQNVQPGDPYNPAGLTPETLLNAREPFMDADGDGIADSFFGAVGVLHELANAAAGKSVRARGLDASQLEPNALAFLMWSQFDQTARYRVAARVKSHGGMVQVAAASNQVQWNSDFTARMFNWIRHPQDYQAVMNLGLPEQRTWLYRMHSSRAAVEPLLRRRGGLLVGYQESRGSGVGVPAALWNLENVFWNTFVPDYSSSKENNWQPFNLASLNEWNAWRQAVSMDAEVYNLWFAGSGSDPRPYYAPRQLLTTVNYSDELARIQDPDKNLATWGGPMDHPNALGLRPGALKYYLGRITDLTVPQQGGTGAPRGAFFSDGSFNDSMALMSGRTTPQGFVVVRELAHYFYEMLSGHKGWRSDDPNMPPDPNGLPVSRRQQAFMLAVNTVAFAAPRDQNGDIDTVYYVDNDDPLGARVYYGYAPQPFITQVAACEKEYYDQSVMGTAIALAIELYNPNDPEDVTGGWRHDLNLARYAISVNDDTNFATLGNLSPTGRLPGRSFLAFAVNDGSNTVFDNAPYIAGKKLNLHVGRPASGPIKVKLWQASLTGLWHVVDQADVYDPNAFCPWTEGCLPPDQDPDPNDPNDYRWWIDTQRETKYESYLGFWNGQKERGARWRMVMASPLSAANTTVKLDEPPPPDLLASLGVGVSESSSVAEVFGPCVPLYTMNARFGTVTLHGAKRPASFPTVGFMLFIPRFCHVQTAGGALPMGRLLYDLWQAEGYNYEAQKYPPADFGHMPIFDNKQDELNDPNLPDFHETGRVPWGLLVFDYFTTLNPSDASNPVDPYRVPGRINVNSAPWYVLAGLPLFGPTVADPCAPNAHLPFNGLAGMAQDTDISPAFWHAASGVLAGKGAAGTLRYPSQWNWIGKPSGSDPPGQWYRLGPCLGQAVAAYRDRVAYVTSQLSGSVPVLGVADQRNLNNRYRDETRYGWIRRLDAASGFEHRGLLTLGELANVMGFDGSTAQQLGGGASSTVLGGYSVAWLGGDFMKAVSLLALLDTHFLTTRSNTFTIYTALVDHDNPQASTCSTVTIDRSNLLPRLIWQDVNGNGIQDPPNPSDPYYADRYSVLRNTGAPEIIGRRESPYYNTRYDE